MHSARCANLFSNETTCFGENGHNESSPWACERAAARTLICRRLSMTAPKYSEPTPKYSESTDFPSDEFPTPKCFELLNNLERIGG